ncbi:uncharacterized protein LOC1274960 isoform X1 [Anopheles gambiae]|uniref:uncharacterized protein LOC1274960 isoform X1 n=1 Tax=Anopheles gambiae TaxID=7165 RepID=UPI002AC9101A|nr:uncharacterized protein LOC1274960 isoform X1 [Anopheles gambiae]
MGQPLVSSCCRCYSLRSGSIATGVLGILLSIISIILIFTVRIDFKTILMDWLPQNVVKIIYALNLVMTILISLLMIMGVMKVSRNSKQYARGGMLRFGKTTLCANWFRCVCLLQKNHFFMMPWVVLGLMLAIGLLISVIYNAVVYFIDGYVLGGTLWIVVGLLSVGKCGCYTHPDQLAKV